MSAEAVYFGGVVEGRWFGVGCVVAGFEQVWIISFLCDFGSRHVGFILDWMGFIGGLVGGFCL